MAIIETVWQGRFIDSFNNRNRGENFSYNALCELYEYYENLSEDIGEDIELDPIAICGEWNEYNSIEEVLKEYQGYETIEEIENDKTVIRFNGESFLIQVF